MGRELEECCDEHAKRALPTYWRLSFAFSVPFLGFLPCVLPRFLSGESWCAAACPWALFVCLASFAGWLGGCGVCVCVCGLVCW